MIAALRNATPNLGQRYRSFGTFLDTIQGTEPGGTAEVAATRGTATGAEHGDGSAAGDILRYLHAQGPRPVAEVMQASGLGVLDFGNVIQALSEANLVQLTRGGEGESVTITGLGRKLVSLP
jgi:predicted transcriptional regulator